MLEKLNNEMFAKIDKEMLDRQFQTYKNEVNSQLDIIKSDLLFVKKGRDDKLEDRLTKVEHNSLRSLDDIFMVKESIK